VSGVVELSSEVEESGVGVTEASAPVPVGSLVPAIPLQSSEPRANVRAFTHWAGGYVSQKRPVWHPSVLVQVWPTPPVAVQIPAAQYAPVPQGTVALHWPPRAGVAVHTGPFEEAAQ
jgi:hypothetical protein